MAVSCNPPSGFIFPLGATPVTCTATDASGNQATAVFYVHVTTNPDRVAGGVIPAATGGSICTPDNSVTFTAPAAALPQNTHVTITETGTGFQLVSDQGAGTALYGVVIEAGGATFANPVTIVLTWPDADNDGIVDGTQIAEANLVLTKDGVVMAGIPDTDANTFSVQVSSLSEFFLVFIDKEGPITGNVTAAPCPVPVNTPMTLSATVDDAQTGATPIGSAEYALDGGAYVAMAAADGAFNQVSETVTASLTAFAQAGVHTIQVRGWDAMKNVPGSAETLFLPVYDPSGGFVSGMTE